MPGLDSYRLDGHILDGFQRPPFYDPRKDAKIIVRMDGSVINQGDSSHLISVTGTPTFITGKFGQCYSAKDATSITLDTGNSIAAGEFTIVMWANVDSPYTTYRRLLWYTDNGRYLGIEFNGSNVYTINLSNVGGTTVGLWFATGTSSGWHMMTLRKYNGGYFALTCDARDYWSTCYKASTLTNTITGSLTLSHPTYQFDGLIDETYVWNRVLTDEELDYLYNNGLGRP